MTNKKFLLGVLILAFLFGMALVGCGDDPVPGDLPQTIKYEGIDASGNAYTLTITENKARAAYTVVANDSYVLIIKMEDGTEKTSRGTVTVISTDGTFTLRPSAAGSDTFSITVSGTDITSIIGTITVEKGEAVTPRTFDTIYLRVNRWTNEDRDHGENWGTSTSIKLFDFHNGMLKTGDQIKLSGTIDKTLEHANLELHRIRNSDGGWEYLGGDYNSKIITAGPFEQIFTLDLQDDFNLTDGEIIVQLTNVLNHYYANGTALFSYDTIPKNIPNWTIMSAINNFKISFVESGDGGDDGGDDNGDAAWWKWVEDSANNLTLNFEEQQDGIVKITVGGTPSPDRWKAIVGYTNPAQILQQGKYHKYQFEMWTDSGTRNVNVQCYGDDATDTYFDIYDQAVTTEHKTYEIISKEPHPKAKPAYLGFQCGDTVGVFYVKIISITETETSGGGGDTNIDNVNGFYADTGAYEIKDYDGRSNVIKVDGSKTSWAVVMYSLAEYQGKMITIELTAEVKREGAAGTLRWQLNNGQNYPEITSLDNAAAGVWHQMNGRIIITPASDNYYLYLTNWENNKDNTTYYIANPTVNITEGDYFTPDFTLTPLKSVYTNFLMGNIIDTTYLTGKYFDLLKHHFNIVTPGNNLKPDFLAPSAKGGAYRWETADEMVNKMISNGIPVHGHVLVWHGQTHSWMTTGTREEVESNMKNHITTVLNHFKGKISSWDVVNEAIRDEIYSFEDWKYSVRHIQNPWYDALGPDYIEIAFRTAREVDPDITLYYNDYNLENPDKVEIVRKMIEDINARYRSETDGTRNLIEGVGSQAHVNLGLNITNVRSSLEKLFSLGIEVSITELDVSTAGYEPGSGRDSVMSVADETAQARIYAELFKLYKEYANSITRVTFWGMDDNNSWLSVGNPCLFDSKLNAKKAFHAVSDPAAFLAVNGE